MKTTDCLCRKVLGWLVDNFINVALACSLVFLGYAIRVTLDNRQPLPTVEIEMMDKDGEIIWRDSLQKSKDKKSIEIKVSTDVWPENPTWALMKVRKEDIKHAHRVVVRLK